MQLEMYDYLNEPEICKVLSKHFRQCYVHKMEKHFTITTITLKVGHIPVQA